MASRDEDRPLPPLRIASVRDARNGQGSEKKEKEKRSFFSRGKSSGNSGQTYRVHVFEARVASSMNISGGLLIGQCSSE